MKTLFQWIIFAMLLILLAAGWYYIATSVKSDQAVRTIQSNQTISRQKSPPQKQSFFSRSKEPSPYSLSWGTLLACVVDQQGEPVSNAKITLKAKLKKDCDGNITEPPPAWHETTVMANEKGEFAIPPQVWNDDPEKKCRPRLTIEAEGFLNRTVAIGVNYGSDDDGKIDIFRIGRIEGVVIGPDGNPIANAPVRMDTYTDYHNPNSSCRGCFDTHTKTDENGTFVFDKAPPGTHFVKYPGYAGCQPTEEGDIPFKEYATWQMVQMTDGQVMTDAFLDLRQLRVQLTGKVVDTYNRPMAGVKTRAYQEVTVYSDDGSATFTNNQKSVLTDENGVYVLDHLPIGNYQLKAEYPYEKGKNYKAGQPIGMYLSASQTVSFDLVLERQDGSLPKPTDKQSLFEVPLPQDMGDQEFMVVDQTGRSIARATVEFAKTIEIKDPQQRKDWPGAVLTTDQEGRFTLPKELQSNEEEKRSCRMTIKAEGFQSRGVQSDSYYKDNDPRIDLLRKGTIKGQFLDEKGQSVGGTVYVANSATSFKNPSVMTSSSGSGFRTSSKDGQFEITGLREGIHVLRYGPFNHDTGRTEPAQIAIVSLLGQQDIKDLKLILTPAVCSIKGRVLNAKGKPVSKAKVQLLKEIQMFGRYGMTAQPLLAQSEPTNRKGEYVIENVVPGIYQIEAVHDGKQRKTSNKMTIGLSGPQPAEIEIRLKP